MNVKTRRHAGHALPFRLIRGTVLPVFLLMAIGCGPYIQDAVRADDPVLLQKMIDRGADPFKTGFKGETLLHLAANDNALEAARLLLESGLAVDARDKDGRSPLHLAVFKGHGEMTALLIAHGADAALADRRGRTPLHLARVGGHPELISLMDPDTGPTVSGNRTEEENWFALGNRLVQAGANAAAARAYRMALDLQGPDAKIYFNLGLCRLRLEQIDRALEAFEAATRLDRDYARAYYNIGVIRGRQGRFDAAAAAFQEVLRIDHEDADAWYNLGNSFDGLARYDRALAAWKEALRLAPSNPDPRYNMAVALDRLGRREEARRHHEALKRTHPEMATELGRLLK